MPNLFIRDSGLSKTPLVTTLLQQIGPFSPSHVGSLFLNGASFRKLKQKRKNESRRILAQDYAENVNSTDQRHVSVEKCSTGNEDSKTRLCLRFWLANWTIRNTASTRNQPSWRFSQLLVNIHKRLLQMETELQNASAAFLTTLSRSFIHEHMKLDIIAHEGCVHYNTINPSSIAAVDSYENMSHRTNSKVEPLHQGSVSEYIARCLHCNVEEVKGKLHNTGDIKKEVIYEKIYLLLRKGVSQENILKYLQHIWNLDVKSTIEKLDELNLDVAQCPLLLVLFDLDPSLMLNAEHIARKLNSKMDVIKSYITENMFGIEVTSKKLDLLLKNGIAGPDCMKLLPVINYLELKTLEKVLNNVKLEKQFSFGTEKLKLILNNIHHIVHNCKNPRIVSFDALVNEELKTLSEVPIQDGFIHDVITKNLNHNQKSNKSQKNKEEYIENGGFTDWDIPHSIQNETHVFLKSNSSTHVNFSNDKFSHGDQSSSIEEYLNSHLGVKLKDIPSTRNDDKPFQKLKLFKLKMKMEYFLNEDFRTEDIVKLLPLIYNRELAWIKHVVEETKKYNIDVMEHAWLLVGTKTMMKNFLRNRDRSRLMDEFLYSRLGVRLKDIPLNKNNITRIRSMDVSKLQLKIEYFLSEGFSTEDIVKLLPYIHNTGLAWVKHVVEETKKSNIDLMKHGWLLAPKKKKLKNHLSNRDRSRLMDEFLYSRLGVRLKDIPLNKNNITRIRSMDVSKLQLKIKYFLREGFSTEDIVKLLPYIHNRGLAWVKHVVEETKKSNIDLIEHGWLLAVKEKKLKNPLSNRDRSRLMDEFLYSRLGVRLKDIPLNKNKVTRIRSMDVSKFRVKIEYFLSEGFSAEDIVKLLPYIHNRGLAWIKLVVDEMNKWNIDVTEHAWLLAGTKKTVKNFLRNRDWSGLMDEFLYSRLGVRLNDIPLKRSENMRSRVKDVSKFQLKIEYFLSEGFSTEDIVKILPFICSTRLARLKFVVEEMKKSNIELTECAQLLATKVKMMNNPLSNRDRSRLVDEFLYSRLGVRLKDIPLNKNNVTRIRSMDVSKFRVKIEYFLSEGFTTADIVKIFPFIYNRRLARLKFVVEETKKSNIDLTEHGWLLATTKERVQKFLGNSNR